VLPRVVARKQLLVTGTRERTAPGATGDKLESAESRADVSDKARLAYLSIVDHVQAMLELLGHDVMRCAPGHGFELLLVDSPSLRLLA
jgi:hypothetical protein